MTVYERLSLLLKPATRRSTLVWTLTFFVFLTTSLSAVAGDDNANKWDPFRINTDNGCHIMGAMLTTYFGAQILQKVGVDKTLSIVTSGFVSYFLWTSKEFYHDEFASQGNNTANLIGVTAGMVFAIPFSFPGDSPKVHDSEPIEVYLNR